MTKTLYKFEVAVIYNDESTEPDCFSGYMATYKDALERAIKMTSVVSGSIEPEQTIISIKKGRFINDEGSN